MLAPVFSQPEFDSGTRPATCDLRISKRPAAGVFRVIGSIRGAPAARHLTATKCPPVSNIDPRRLQLQVSYASLRKSLGNPSRIGTQSCIASEISKWPSHFSFSSPRAHAIIGHWLLPRSFQRCVTRNLASGTTKTWHPRVAITLLTFTDPPLIHDRSSSRLRSGQNDSIRLAEMNQSR
jgi:hypothetical protein